ncbi:MAG: tetratricopeptide repeat protein [Pseudomonadota bacterium]
MIRRLSLLTLPLLLGLAGCANNPTEGEPEPGPAQPPKAETAPSEKRTDTTQDSPDLRQIVKQLQEGQNRSARTALQRYLERNPNQPTAKSLLQQLDTDPVVLLGKAHTTHTVQPGDSLGELAARYLGDPIKFVALARYNGIARPKALNVGQVLRIPTSARPTSTEAESLAAPAADAPLKPQTPIVPATPASTNGVRENPRTRIEADLIAGRLDSASRALETAKAQRPADGSWDVWIGNFDRLLKARREQELGLSLLHQGRDEAAMEALGRALQLDPQLEPARRQYGELRRKQVTAYHEAAIVHYRNQRLDEAIDLWDKALALDPQFEPAQGYRLRAQELKRRVSELKD